MQDTKKLTAADLLQFTGSEQWYRHGIVRDVLFTDGAKYVANPDTRRTPFCHQPHSPMPQRNDDRNTQAALYWIVDG